MTYWFFVSGEAWFIAPGMDAEFYSRWADAILAGRGANYIPFPRAPLYPYLLAGIKYAFGSHWLVPRLLNLSCDAVTAVLIFRLAASAFTKPAGLIAAGLFASAGSAIYFSGEVLMTSLETMLAVLFVFCLSRMWRQPNSRSSLWSAVWLGMLCLCRPHALVFAPVTASLAFIITHRSMNQRVHALKISILHAIAFLAVLSPVIYLNYRASGDLIPISTQGGVNFYIGNARGADGWSSTLPGVGGNWDDSDARRIAETAAGHSLHVSGISVEFWKLGLKEIAADPIRWLMLMGRKLMLLIHPGEVGNNRPLLLPVWAFPLLGWLFLLSLGTMLPLALYGAVEGLKRREVKAVLLFCVIYAAVVTLFFVNARYRAPLLPAVALLAGWGVVRFWERLKMRNLRDARLASILTGFGAAAVILSATVVDVKESPAQALFVHGNALMRMNRHREAVSQFRATLEAAPVYPEAHLNLGAALLALGDAASAADEFLLELSHNPNSARAENNLGVIAEGRGDFEQAIAHYERAAHRNPDLTDARVNLCRAHIILGDKAFEAGEWQMAERHYLAAEGADTADPKPPHRLAIVAAAKGDLDAAARHSSEALRRNPSYRPALEFRAALMVRE